MCAQSPRTAADPPWRLGFEGLFAENDLSIEQGEQGPGLADLVHAAAFGERHDAPIGDDLEPGDFGSTGLRGFR